MAQLLCSLLLGVGYDAYVVSGYAPRAITHCDQSAANVPAADAGGAKEAEEEKVRARVRARARARANPDLARRDPSPNQG